MEREYNRYKSQRSASPDAVIAANAQLMASNRRERRHAEEARTLADTHARHEREESQARDQGSFNALYYNVHN